MQQVILDWDIELFKWINIHLSNSFFDSLFPWWRHRNTWFPLYAIVLILVVIKYKLRAVTWIIFAALAPALGDLLSSWVLKGYFARPRPCQSEYLKNIMILRVPYCPSNGSFPSSHAVNHFALGSFFYFTLKPLLKKYNVLWWFWAVSICFGQVYVGVHYPTDILAGGIIGTLIGVLLFRLYRMKWSLKN